jgi:hypothetical protein
MTGSRYYLIIAPFIIIMSVFTIPKVEWWRSIDPCLKMTRGGEHPLMLPAIISPDFSD